MMRTRRKICLVCHQDFTRKSNAERHNKVIHDGNAKIISVNDFLYGPLDNLSDSARQGPALSVQHNRDNEPGDDILVLTLEKIRKEYLELEEELKFLPSDQRDVLLGVAVYNAICSPDAKQSMQRSLSSHRRRGFGSISRMIRCVSLSTNLPPVATQKMLRTQLSKDTD
jgi:hypothetical protein